MKGTKELLLRHDLIKVIKTPWPDLTLTPWFLIYHHIRFALALAGFNSILDNSSIVEFANFQNNSDNIVRLCEESYTASSRLSNGWIRSKKFSKNAVFSLRRELKAVFAISLTLQRTGRNRSKFYKLTLPGVLMDLAYSSTFFQHSTLPKVVRLFEPEIRLTCRGDKSVAHSRSLLEYPPKGVIVGRRVLNSILYNMVDYGGKGNCMFLAVAGGLRSDNQASVHTHYSLCHQVSE